MIEDLMDMKEQYIPLAYGYIFLSMMLAGYLTYRSAAQNKIVVGAISFFLLTGNFNEVITFGLPPDRVLGLICAGYLGWRLVFGGFRNSRHPIWVVPYFQIVLALYIFYIFLSQIVNATTLVTPSSKAMIDIYYAVNFIFLLYGVWATVDQEGLKVIGKCIVIGAAVSGLLSIYQLGIDPLFMRIGDHRIAFGKTLRSNGLFMNEYYNAYFIIIALGWTMVTIHKKWLRFALMGIFVVAVITTFQRMSWLILTMVMSVYIIKVEKVAYEKLAFSGLLAMIGIVFIVLFFQREISNSNFVKERLSEPIDSRYGYYAMVTDNIWKHPVFGYGGVYNELYYYSMLRITLNRKRATGEEGDIHSGYYSTLFFYGLPGFVLFVTFVLLTLAYFARLTTHHLFFVIPFIIALLYTVGNLTNTLLFPKYLSVLFAIHIGIGMAARHMEEFFPVSRASHI